jgi:hypothetical protein
VIEVTARDLPLIKARLKELGDGNTIPREIGREIRAEVPPLRDAVELAALVMLPKRGGLNRWVAESKVRASISYGARKAGVRLVGSRNSRGGKSDLDNIDKGVVRHPTFGHRGGKTRRAVGNGGFGRAFITVQSKNDWHDQAVAPGYFTKTLQRVGTDRMKAASERAIREAVTKLGLR